MKAAADDDTPLIVANRNTLARVRRVVPSKNSIEAHVPNIWVRDFGVVNTPHGLFKFRYSLNYVPRKHARKCDSSIMKLLKQRHIPVTNIPLVVDGGNFCHNGDDKAVLTSRVFADNRSLSKTQVIQKLAAAVGSDQIAILPEEAGDKLGHADGMVKWVTDKKLAVSNYARAGFRRRIRSVLESQFGEDVELIDMTYTPTNRVYKGFLDATGIYVNALTTPNAIYVPTYGIDADDEALAIYKEYADRRVLPISMGSTVAQLGGSVRCLTCTVPM